MKLFDLSEYLWPKMAFKMSQVFPTASLDITEDFHILHNVYLYICYSILKAKAYNRLPNTHRHTPPTCTNKKQLGTSHRLLMAIWLRCFFCVWNSDYFDWWKKKKKEKICWHLDWLWGCLQALIQWGHVSSVCVGLAKAQNGRLHKTGGTYYQSCMYPTNSAWPAFLMPF